MGRMKLHCARSLPEWGTDDAANTELLYDVSLIVFDNATARQVQEARRARNAAELPYDSLSQRSKDELDARVSSAQASKLDVRDGITMIGR